MTRNRMSAAEISGYFGIELTDPDCQVGDAARTYRSVGGRTFPLIPTSGSHTGDRRGAYHQSGIGAQVLVHALARHGIEMPGRRPVSWAVTIDAESELLVHALHLAANGILKVETSARDAARTWVISTRIAPGGLWCTTGQTSGQSLTHHPDIRAAALARLIKTKPLPWTSSCDGAFTAAVQAEIADTGFRPVGDGPGAQPNGETKIPRQVLAVTFQILGVHSGRTVERVAEIAPGVLPTWLADLPFSALVDAMDWNSVPNSGTRLRERGLAPSHHAESEVEQELRAVVDVVRSSTIGEVAQIHAPVAEFFARSANSARLKDVALYDALVTVRYRGILGLDKVGFSLDEAHEFAGLLVSTLEQVLDGSSVRGRNCFTRLIVALSSDNYASRYRAVPIDAPQTPLEDTRPMVAFEGAATDDPSPEWYLLGCIADDRGRLDCSRFPVGHRNAVLDALLGSVDRDDFGPVICEGLIVGEDLDDLIGLADSCAALADWQRAVKDLRPRHVAGSSSPIVRACPPEVVMVFLDLLGASHAYRTLRKLSELR